MVQPACPHGSLDTSKYASPLPIIGTYVAVASLVCFLGIAIDTFRGFWQKKLWFPCKFYSLNAATLTVLAVATKLPVDLSSPMPSRQDQLTKLTGSVMICISMGFFMPSLGDMARAELISNLIAISIMAITVVVNICIQIGTGVIFTYLVEHIIIMACILGVLVILWFSSLPLAISFKQIFDFAYVRSAGPDSLPKTFEKTRDTLKEVWNLTYVVGPQYVLGRSPNCITVSILCGISMIVLLQAILGSFLGDNSSFCGGVSDYGFSIWGVFAAQISSIGIAGVATTTRWLVLAYNAGMERFGPWRDLFMVEDYHLRWLKGLKNHHLLAFENGFLSRILRGLIKATFYLLIVSQKGIVMVGKLMCFSSVWSAFLLKKYLGRLCYNSESSIENSAPQEIEIVSFILGEKDLVKWLSSNSEREWTRWQNKCNRSVPSHLIELLSKQPTTGTCDLDNPSSMDLVLVMRTFMLLSSAKGERTRLLVNAVNEGLEIIYFMEQNSYTFQSSFESKLSFYIWSSRNDPNHWLNKRFRNLSTELQSINTTQVDRILETLSSHAEKLDQSAFHKAYFEFTEEDFLLKIISFLRLRGPYQSISDLLNFLEETACTLLHDLLKNLPRAIIEEFTHFHEETSNKRVKRAIYFLYKAEMLQQYINFTWHEI